MAQVLHQRIQCADEMLLAMRTKHLWIKFVCLVVFLTSSSATRLYRRRVPKLTSDNLCAATHKTERGDHDFCLSRTHYTDTDSTSRERAATAGIEPRTSSPGVARIGFLRTLIAFTIILEACDLNLLTLFLQRNVTGKISHLKSFQLTL